MTRKFIYPLALLLFLVSCSKESIAPNENPSSPDQDKLLSNDEINELVFKSLKETKRFYWNNVAPNVVWSALVNSDSILSIGYKPANMGDLSEIMADIDIKSPEWLAAKNKVLNRIASVQASSTGQAVDASDIRYYQSERLPYIQIQTGNYEVVKALKEMDEVRYADAMGYGIAPDKADLRSGSGCGAGPLSYLPGGDQTSYGTNGILPWNFNKMNITQAWSNSNKGSGITIGLIDTGVADGQDNLGSRFATGNSTGRTIQKYSTYETCTGIWWWKRCTNDGPNDQCGHGTSMAGLIAAPLGTNTRSTMGVAYKANLISYRGTSDVIINASEEKQGVSDALEALGNRSSVKIISMSIGDIFHSGQVEDAVEYAYARGKLIFAAAGTSLTWTNWYGVIFPAYLSEAVAVTGITDRPNTLEECGNCHYGSEVEFSVIMQRYYNDSRTSLSLTRTHNSPINYPSYVGGSSSATATMAGTAALVWSDHPSWSRWSVLNKLRQSSSLYPNRNSDFGYGTVDANAAVQ